MTEFLVALATLTLGGGAAILLLLLVGQLTGRRYSARWRCWAWLLLAVRLALPLSPSVLPQTRAPVQLPLPSNPVIYEYTPPVQGPDTAPSGHAPGTVPAPPVQRPAGADAGPDTAVPSSAFSLTLSQALFSLWLAGAAGVLGWNLICHLRFRRWLRRWAEPVTDSDIIALFNRLGNQLGLDRRPRLLWCRGVAAPMLAGLLRPTVLLPENPPRGQALDFALRHELTHYRRRDIWLKALMLWVNALHWFNPLVWLMARAVERDTELACDDGVLHALPPEERTRYSRTILDTVDALRKET